MQASQWIFAGQSGDSLRIVQRHEPSRRSARHGADRRRTAHPAREQAERRQSGLWVIFSSLRRLPLCTTIAAAAAWVAARLLPIDIRWTVGAWSAGLLGLGLALGSAAVSWNCCRWQLTHSRLLMCSGVLTRKECSIRPEAIQSAELESTPFTALFRCAWLYVRTTERGQRREDRLLLGYRDAVLLSGQLLPNGTGRTHHYRCGRLSLWLAAVSGEGLSAFYSAAASLLSAARDGTVIAAAATTAASALGETLSGLLNVRGTVIAALSLLIIIWLLKATHTLLTCSGMSLSRFGGVLILSRGVMLRRTERIAIGDICALENRRSLPSLLTGRQSCSVLTCGGQRFPLLLPVGERRLRIETAAIAPHGSRVCTVCSHSSPIGYALGRWAACLSVLPLASALRRLMPAWNTTIVAVGLTAALLLMWRALVTTVCVPSAGLTLCTDCMELTGVRGLTIRTLRISRPAVGMIRITQSPINRALGRCTVRAFPRGKGTSLSCIKLPAERAVAACERMM